MKKIQEIIDHYFDWDFFWRSEKSLKFGMIEEKGKSFISDNPDLSKRIIADFRSNFPDAKIIIFSPFIVEDRCLCFEVTFDSQNIFVICISIFNYFLAWKLYDGYPYRRETYIQKGTSEWIDSTYELVIEQNVEIQWISTDEAYYEINEFNLGEGLNKGDPEVMSPIVVANLLTRFG